MLRSVKQMWFQSGDVCLPLWITNKEICGHAKIHERTGSLLVSGEDVKLEAVNLGTILADDAKLPDML